MPGCRTPIPVFDNQTVSMNKIGTDSRGIVCTLPFQTAPSPPLNLENGLSKRKQLTLWRRATLATVGNLLLTVEVLRVCSCRLEAVAPG